MFLFSQCFLRRAGGTRIQLEDAQIAGLLWIGAQFVMQENVITGLEEHSSVQSGGAHKPSQTQTLNLATTKSRSSRPLGRATTLGQMLSGSWMFLLTKISEEEYFKKKRAARKQTCWTQGHSIHIAPILNTIQVLRCYFWMKYISITSPGERGASPHS